MCLTAFVFFIECDDPCGELNLVTFLNNFSVGLILIQQIFTEHLQCSQISPYPQGIIAIIIAMQIGFYLK